MQKNPVVASLQLASAAPNSDPNSPSLSIKNSQKIWHCHPERSGTPCKLLQCHPERSDTPCNLLQCHPERSDMPCKFLQCHPEHSDTPYTLLQWDPERSDMPCKLLQCHPERNPLPFSGINADSACTRPRTYDNFIPSQTFGARRLVASPQYKSSQASCLTYRLFSRTRLNPSA